MALALGDVLRRPMRFRLTSAVHHLDRVGWQAVPIILLITFLIGGIIAQQGSSISASSAPTNTSSTWSASSCCARSAC